MSNSIYDLKLHEGLTVESTVGRNYEITYRITRVHGGWIYRSLSENGVTSVFVPYTRHGEGVIDNDSQLGNREVPQVSGKSTQDVAESNDLAEAREMISGLTEDQKTELLRILQQRGH